MFPTKAALVLLLHAYIYLIARGQTMSGGGDCLDIADVALVVDVSGSIEGEGKSIGKFDDYVKPFLKQFCRGLKVGPGKVQIGMVTFGDYGILEFGLMDDINEVIRNIDLFDYESRGKDRNTSGGINVVRTQLLSPKDPKYRKYAAHIAVVVTDGRSTRDFNLTIPSGEAAHKEGIIILSVGVTNSVDYYELARIASPLTPYNLLGLLTGITNGTFVQGGTVAYVPKFTDLIVLVNQIVAYFKETVCRVTRNCPGGDKAEWCKNISDSWCYNATVNATCCKRCELVFTGCNNNANWCTSMHPRQCYDNVTERICCQFCRERLKPNPNCRYGDALQWCRPEECGDKTLNCCETCPYFECRNNADACSTIVPGQCYDRYTEQTCCRRCRELLTGNPACRYGDEAPGCTLYHCKTRDAPRCCATCPPTECKDNANWCSTILREHCYATSTEQTCCQTCRRYLRSDLGLTCRYGDDVSWCKSQHCFGKENTLCCRTCPKF